MISEKKEEEMEEEEKTKHLLSKVEISLLLDTYDDIFSDFDPRPFAQRALSDDFLLEAKKAARDKNESFELSFLIPKHQRNIEHEALIKRRMRDHFRKHALLLENEIHAIKSKGIFMAIMGILMILVASFLYSFEGRWIVHLLIVIFEPAGWFLFWIGGEKLVYERRDKYPDYEFYQKMTHAEITFHPY